jgi:hypothetical protein
MLNTTTVSSLKELRPSNEFRWDRCDVQQTQESWAIHKELLILKVKEKSHLTDPGISRMMVLFEWMLKKDGVSVWSGFIWLRMRTGSGLLWAQSLTLGFVKAKNFFVSLAISSFCRCLLHAVSSARRQLVPLHHYWDRRTESWEVTGTATSLLVSVPGLPDHTLWAMFSHYVGTNWRTNVVRTHARTHPSKAKSIQQGPSQKLLVAQLHNKFPVFYGSQIFTATSHQWLLLSHKQTQHRISYPSS